MTYYIRIITVRKITIDKNDTSVNYILVHNNII